MKKKGLSLLLALVLVFVSTIAAFGATFSDVKEDFWAQEDIEKLSSKEIISGYPDGTFKPENNITKEEAVSLFARALGYNDKANEKLIGFADEISEGLLSKYDSYAKSQAAYLIYKEAISKDDVNTYMATAKKGQPLLRYEAATLIAKALGADAWLDTNPDYELEFVDADDIVLSAQPYVFYASEQGIIKGMDGGKFEPNGNVTRAQVAVMINRILEKMEFTYQTGIVTGLESALNTMSLKLSDGLDASYNVGEDVLVTINGEKAEIEEIEDGLTVIITRSNDKMYAVDAIKVIPDELVEGIYKGKLTDSTSTKIKIADKKTSKITEYALSDDVSITYEGKAAGLAQFKTNDYVKADIKDGKVAFLSGEPKTVLYEGLIVEAIEFDPDVKLRLKNYDEIITFDVKSGATLKRNGDVTEFTELAVGDKVNVTVEYGVVSSVVAFGVDKTTTGIIEEITISRTTSYLTMNIDDELVKYNLSRDVSIKIEGAAATLYDLRVGANAQFKLSSNTITDIDVKQVATSSQVTGTVKLVNSTYGMIVVDAVDASGNIKETQIFVKSTAKILDAADGRVKTVKDIKEGKNIMAAGALNTGVFEATSIIILAN